MNKAVVCVSFGTSVPAARESITAVEDALRQAAGDRLFVTALTSPTIRRILKERGEAASSLDEALAALTMLGFDRKSSQKVLDSLYGADPTMKSEVAIKKALSMM